MKGRDVGKLFKLREWLTLADAAQHLSIMFGEDVREADVLRLALDGHLKLSVRFVNTASARRGTFVSLEEKIASFEGIKFEMLPNSSKDAAIKMISELYPEGGILEIGKEIVTLDGVWDLPMIGSEELDVEHEYQILTDGPAVTLQNLEGVFVAGSDGTLYQLQEHFSDNEYFKKENLKTPWGHLANYYPAGGLPSDSVFVVRTSAIQDLEARISKPDTYVEKPIELRERTTLLMIIAALAQLAKIDISKPSSAATSIENQTALMGARVAARTIENHLKRIPEAKESRSQP